MTLPPQRRKVLLELEVRFGSVSRQELLTILGRLVTFNDGGMPNCYAKFTRRVGTKNLLWWGCLVPDDCHQCGGREGCTNSTPL
jgi:hypothetical protein